MHLERDAGADTIIGTISYVLLTEKPTDKAKCHFVAYATRVKSGLSSTSCPILGLVGR